MSDFSMPVQLRWSDLDPNFHVRHSVYYDFGASCRMAFLNAFGLTAGLMQQHNFGPILFREEAVFKREIHYGNELVITAACSALRRDFSRFSFQHKLMRGDEVCALLNVDGAWMDTTKRKLGAPPQEAIEIMEKMPRSEGFEWIG
jgi:acyl-CoA thioester hydrolase